MSTNRRLQWYARTANASPLQHSGGTLALRLLGHAAARPQLAGTRVVRQLAPGPLRQAELHSLRLARAAVAAGPVAHLMQHATSLRLLLLPLRLTAVLVRQPPLKAQHVGLVAQAVHRACQDAGAAQLAGGLQLWLRCRCG